MANDSRTLFQSAVRKGMSDREALFAILDHFAQLHCFDRDRYDERVKVLEKGNAEKDADIANLKARVAELEARTGQP